MADTSSPQPTAADLPIISTTPVSYSPLVRWGGLLGVVASTLGLVLLLVACGGIEQALRIGVVSIILGAVGIVLTLVGALAQRDRLGEDTHVLAALFACVFGALAGLAETVVAYQWPIFWK